GEPGGGLGAEGGAGGVSRERQRPTGVLLLNQAEAVGGVAALGLDLLLAVPEVVVCDHRDDHAALVTHAQLEGGGAVVELVLVAPALAVAALALGGVVVVGQAKVLLAELGQVGGQDDGAGVPGPGRRVEGGVVVGKERVPGIAED